MTSMPPPAPRSDRPDHPLPDGPTPTPQRAPSPRRWFLLFLLGLVVALMWLPFFQAAPEENLSSIRTALRTGEVESLVIVSGESRVEGRFRGESEEQPGPPFSSAVPTEEVMTSIVQEVDAWNRENPDKHVEYAVLPIANIYLVIFLQTLPWLLFGGALVWLIWRHGKNMGMGSQGGFGRNQVRMLGERPRVTFDDVAGVQEAKEEVYEVVEFLKDSERFQSLGGRIPRGVLLVGPPGTGKTLLAKAVAGEARVPFFTISGSDFVEMFVGVGASRVRELFRQARENAPSIVFLDEIDAVGRRRGSSIATGSEEREQTLNAILVEMDGFASDSQVIVMAASNRPDVLDPALLRPGRFDREISVDLPDSEGRLEILRVHTRQVPLAEDLELEAVARGTPTFSGADLEALVNEAALIAGGEGRKCVEMPDFEEARDKVRWGRARLSRKLVEEDRRITAYHEAGHAILALLIPEVEPLHKVTIIPRGPALGATMQLPERDRYQISRRGAEGNLKVLFGGRIAESRFCGDYTSGASNDLERASELARRMVCEWGMSDAIGPVVYVADDHGEGSAGLIPMGAELRRDIDVEIRRVLDSAYRSAEELIEAHADGVEAIAMALLEKETLNAEEVAALLDETSSTLSSDAVPA